MSPGTRKIPEALLHDEGARVVKVQRAVVNGGGEANPAPPSLTVIERRADLSPEQFNAEYRVPRRPVILSDAASDWPLYRHATPADFRFSFPYTRFSEIIPF